MHMGITFEGRRGKRLVLSQEADLGQGTWETEDRSCGCVCLCVCEYVYTPKPACSPPC